MHKSGSPIVALGAFGFALVLVTAFFELPLLDASGASYLRTWGGPGSDVARRVALDSSGNVIITGFTTSFGAGNADVLLLKYDHGGNLLTQETWGGSLSDIGKDVATDSSGNIYVTGSTSSFGNNGGAFLLKFDAQGRPIWQRTWGGTSSAVSGQGITLDPAGDIYITGEYETPSHSYVEAFLLKFNATGGLVSQIGWHGNSQDEGSDLAVDASGNVYVTGWTASFDATSCLTGRCFDNFLLNFNSSGSLQWQRVWRVTSGYARGDQAAAIALDSSGNSYVAGFSCFFDCNTFSAALSKLNSTGGLLWEKIWSQTYIRTPVNDQFSDVALDSSGNTFMTGFAGGDVLFMKLDSSGSPRVVSAYGGSAPAPGWEGVAVYSSGIPVVAGTIASGDYTHRGDILALQNSSSEITTPAGVIDHFNLTMGTISGTILNATGKTEYAGLTDVFVSYGGAAFPVSVFSPVALALILGLATFAPKTIRGMKSKALQ